VHSVNKLNPDDIIIYKANESDEDYTPTDSVVHTKITDEAVIEMLEAINE